MRRLAARQQDVESDLFELFQLRVMSHGRRHASWRYLTDVASLWRWRPGRGTAPRTRWAHGHANMTQDLVFAVRLLRRHPAMFGITIAGLAVAIGVTTAALSVAKSIASTGYGAAESTMVYKVSLTSGVFRKVTGNSPFQGQWAFDDFSRLASLTSTTTLVGWAQGAADVRQSSSDGAPIAARYLAVTGDYFTVLGMRASAGRLLFPADDAPGAATVVVSEGFWKNRLGANPSIVGRRIWLDDRAYTVVGIVDRKHTMPSPAQPNDLWIALAAAKETSSRRTGATAADVRGRLAARRNQDTTGRAWEDRYAAIEADLSEPSRPWNPAIEVLGRLNPGFTRAQAETEIGAFTLNLANAAGWQRATTVRLEPIDGNSKVTRVIAAMLMSVVGLVLFVACANVTNVLLASAASRRREIATRLAMGAGRGRILRQLLTESLLLGSISSLLGLAVARAVLPSFAALIQMPPGLDVSPDLWIYASLGILTIVVGLLAGLAPARYGQSQDLATTLKADQASAPLPLPRPRLRSLLIATQAAVSLVLLVLASLFTRSLIEMATATTGTEVDQLMTISIGSPTSSAAWDPARRDGYWTALLHEVRETSGVAAAAIALAPPFGGTMMAPQRVDDIMLDRNEVADDYFQTVGIPILRGRAFTRDEIKSNAPVAIISASLADAVWRSENPIGSSLDRVWGPPSAGDARLAGPLRKPRNVRVIGVVGDATTRLDRPRLPTVYLPISSTSVPRLVVRTHGNPGLLVQPLRNLLESFDPRLTPTVTFAREDLRRQMEKPRVLAVLSLSVGTLAMGLAVIGLFGVTAFIVEQRTHELSVRCALGASRADLTTMLLRDSLRPVIAGLACGLFIALAGARVVQSLLSDVSARDPVAVVAAVLVLMAASSAAVLLPARRAARLNPAQLLKLG
jgi:predicted permease